MNLIATTLLSLVFVIGTSWTATAVAAEPTPAEADAIAKLQVLQAYVREGKRDFVAEQLALSEGEAAKFWPVYDAHQEALTKLNKRRVENILAYARVWNAGSISDADATPVAKEALSIEKAEAALMESTFGKLKKAVPVIKAVRYLQIESKLRAILRYEQAAAIPYAD